MLTESGGGRRRLGDCHPSSNVASDPWPSTMSAPWSTPRPILATSSSFLNQVVTPPSSPSPTTLSRRRTSSGTKRAPSGAGSSPGGRVDQSEKPKEPIGSKDRGCQGGEQVNALRVIEDVLKTSAGRDKLFKVLQYSIKIFLWTRRRGKASSLDARMKQTASSFSLARSACSCLLDVLSQTIAQGRKRQTRHDSLELFESSAATAVYKLLGRRSAHCHRHRVRPGGRRVHAASDGSDQR